MVCFQGHMLGSQQWTRFLYICCSTNQPDDVALLKHWLGLKIWWSKLCDSVHWFYRGSMETHIESKTPLDIKLSCGWILEVIHFQRVGNSGLQVSTSPAVWISSGTLLAMANKAKSVKKDVRLYSKMDKTARVKATKKAVGSKLIFENRALLGKDFKMLIVCDWY